jgi:uncharacterized membrane protein
LKSGVRFAVVIEVGLVAVLVPVVLLVFGLARVFCLDFVFALALLLAFMVGSLGTVGWANDSQCLTLTPEIR